jgi:peptide chain release factor subunit 1
MLVSILRSKIIKTVTISYGGDIGFNQAIQEVSKLLHDVKYIKEIDLIEHYFNEISQDTGKYCFGIKDIMTALELGAIEILICWENLDLYRCIFKHNILYLTSRQIIDKKNEKGMELIESQLFLEWIVDNYKSYGTILEIISNNTSEGSQFVKGFGGFGGILRFKIDFQLMQLDSDYED